MQPLFDACKSLFQFLARPISWLIILAAVIFIGISSVIFIYGFDFRLPERLVCGNASNTYMVIILMTGFLFIVTAIAGIGSVFNIVDSWRNNKTFNLHDIWLPLAAICLGAVSFALQMMVCG